MENIIKCPYCNCFFFHSSDLSRHLQTFVQPSSVEREVRINKEDHVKLFTELHKKMDWREPIQYV